MKILNLTQGTPEWLAERARHFTASEATAMLGLSNYQTRDALLRIKKTGIAPEVDSGTQRLFDRGHEVEALARPIAESIIGDDLYPVTGSLGIDNLKLLASFDGLTMDEVTAFEHKLFNQKLADYIKANNDLPDTHWPQAEQLMLVSDATSVLFMTSDGTEEGSVWMRYESKPERRAALLAGWKQFAVDLAAYEVQDVKPEPAKAAVETLPAVFVQVQGSLVCEDNIGKFAAQLTSFLDRIPVKPETDDDFAVCEAAVKTLGNAEDALKAAKGSSLGAIQSLADLHQMIDTQAEIARSNRLRLEKLVKAEKDNRKTAIALKVSEDYRAWLCKLPNYEYLSPVIPDFAGATKGLKTITSIQSAVNDALASAKIAATNEHDKITANLETINNAKEFAFLFNDKRDLVRKDAELVALTVQSRIDQHKAAETQRIEVERARMQAEADAKAKADAEKQMESERAKIMAEERARAEAQAMAEREAAERLQAATPAPVVAPVASQSAAVALSESAKKCDGNHGGPRCDDPECWNDESQHHAMHSVETVADTSATMTLGQINAKLAPIQLSADGLRTLGFEFVGTERAAKLYPVSYFPRICEALIAHINAASKGE